MDAYESLKLENQLCFPLYAVSRSIIKRYRPFLETLNLTYTQYITMLVLWEKRSVSVKELGKKLFLDSGTLTPVLKALEQKDYLTRHRSKEDERVLIVSLTDSGAALQEKALAIPSRINACAKLKPEDAQTMHRLLYQLLQQLEETEPT